MISYAKNKNLIVNVITNGFWGKNEENAEKIIKNLKKNGLNELSMSVDDFHQEFIEIKSIKNILKLCRKYKIKTSIGFGITKQNYVGKYIDYLNDLLINTKVVFYPIIPVGSANKNLNSEIYYDETKYDDKMMCPNNGIISVLYDGNYYPCCSQIIKEGNLEIASIEDTTLSDAINLCMNNKFLFIMKIKGLRWIYDIIIENNLKNFNEEKYYTTCDLCKNIFKDKELIEKLIPFIDKEINEICK